MATSNASTASHAHSHETDRRDTAGRDTARHPASAPAPRHPDPATMATPEQPTTLTGLAPLFLERAALLAPYARGAAAAWREAAGLLARALAAADDKVLTIAGAAREAGWSYEALRRRVVADPALNAGVTRAPRITRRALRALGPGRAGATASRPAPARPDRAGGAVPASPNAGPTRLALIAGEAVARRRNVGARP